VGQVADLPHRDLQQGQVGDLPHGLIFWRVVEQKNPWEQVVSQGLVIQRETPTAKGNTLSAGVIIRLGWQARRHFRANPIASIFLKFMSVPPSSQLELREVAGVLESCCRSQTGRKA